MNNQISILHIDRSPLMRLGLSSYLKDNGNYRFIPNTIVDGNKALTSITQKTPSIVILDYDLESLNAWEIAIQIFQNQSGSRVILLCDAIHLSAISEIQRNAMDISILMRDSSLEDIKKCIDYNINNITYTCSQYDTLQYQRNSTPLSSIEHRFKHLEIKVLTPKEHKIMQLISGGSSTRSIADQLCLSNRTIDAHRLKILKKLCLKGNTALVRFAIENKPLFSINK